MISMVMVMISFYLIAFEQQSRDERYGTATRAESRVLMFVTLCDTSIETRKLQSFEFKLSFA